MHGMQNTTITKAKGARGEKLKTCRKNQSNDGIHGNQIRGKNSKGNRDCPAE